MKKTIYILAGAVALLLCSCGGKTQQNPDELDSTEQLILSDSVLAQLDSIASQLAQIADTCQLGQIFTAERINLSREQQLVKPDYLLTQKDIDDLMTLNQKYVAMAYLSIDNSVQQLYRDQDTDDDYYDNAMARLAADTEAANQKAAERASNKPLNLDNARDFYNDMKQRNRLDKFYLAQAAYMVEALYVISNNVDLYMPAIDDATAFAMSQRLATARQGAIIIAGNHDQMKPVVEALQLISGINATTAAQLRQQIESSKAKIQQSRDLLLKE